MRVRKLRKTRHRALDSKRYPGLLGIGAVAIAIFMMASMVNLSRASTTTYADQTLSGGYQAGHFADVWDLTAGDITISFTYNANGMVDDFGGAAHAWAELGVKSMWTTSDFNPYGVNVYWTKTVNLIADGGADGEHLDIGSVSIQRIDNTLYVTFEVDLDGWFITSTHLDVQDAISKIPQTKAGNPIPGLFAYVTLHDPPATEYQYAIDVSGYAATTKLFIAAHTSVIHVSEVCVDVVSDTSVGWSSDGSTYTPAVACYVHPSWPTAVADAGATWIWRGPTGADDPAQLTDPITQYVISPSWEYSKVPDGGWWFKKTLTPAGAYDIVAGDLQVDADNGEAIYVNNNLVLTDGTMLRDGPDAHEWETIETVDVNPYLVQGENTLVFRALNYFPTNDGYSNPAGLIFKVHVCYKIVDRMETAWGSGAVDFRGNNWASCITYKAGGETPVTMGSGVWLATDYDWTANTFDPTPGQDIDDKLVLQAKSGNDEGFYDLPSTPASYGNNYGFWADRDGVDQWQALMWGMIDGDTYNTAGFYDVVITLHAIDATTATAYMTMNGVPQGFYNGPWYDGQPSLYPAGLTWHGDMHQLVVFYGLYGYGATHTAVFSDITVTQ